MNSNWGNDEKKYQILHTKSAAKVSYLGKCHANKLIE